MEDTILRVKGSTSATSLGSVIAHLIYENKLPVLRTIGAAATNQAVKAIIIAQSYVAARGHRIVVIPGFADVEMEDGTISALVFKLRIE